MEIIPVKTPILNPPKDDLWEILKDALPKLQDGDIVLITSKVVSIDEGRYIPCSEIKNKDDLIYAEADYSLPRESTPNKNAILTLKHNLLIPSAGLDESNANDHYILLPEDPKASAKKLWEKMTQYFQIKNLGVIITDSTSHPLRYGVVSMSLGFWGFCPLRDYRERTDLFGRGFEMSQTNIPDSLAATAAVSMGEGDEQKPMVIARNVPDIKFSNQDHTSDFLIPEQQDLFYPLLQQFYK